MDTYNFLVQELFGGKRYQKFDPKKVSHTLTNLWIEGMQARGGQRAGSEISSKYR